MRAQLKYLILVLGLVFALAIVFLMVTPVNRGGKWNRDNPREETTRLLEGMGFENIDIYKEDPVQANESCRDWPDHLPVRFFYHATKNGVAFDGTTCGVDVDDDDSWSAWEAKNPSEKTKDLLMEYGYSEVEVYDTGESCWGGELVTFRAVGPNGKKVEGTACGYDPQDYKVWEK